MPPSQKELFDLLTQGETSKLAEYKAQGFIPDVEKLGPFTQQCVSVKSYEWLVANTNVKKFNSLYVYDNDGFLSTKEVSTIYLAQMALRYGINSVIYQDVENSVRVLESTLKQRYGDSFWDSRADHK